jgi:hypothetical protein
MANIGVTLWWHLLIRQDVLKKIMNLGKGNFFTIRIRTGSVPNLVRLVTTSRTSSVILDAYLIKCHVLNVYIQITDNSYIYIYIYRERERERVTRNNSRILLPTNALFIKHVKC